ncbi:MAG TPA: AMP-binding protein [Hypericibacter adhaerens]|uniref:AMP-binding protein n=1 Tax=Hypericibacter adhaerens TaxID=2602016 RepID=UPI002CD2A896|nr:AMP-binding protein [Hypericibacter adhaerens]HWA44269.1 AMP-binding protein [Hypericibacter adhaerens]
MTAGALSHLLCDRQQDARPVACRGGAAISLGQLAAEAAGLAARARSSGWQRAALTAQDSYSFVVGLLGLMHGGCEVLLPANRQPGTLEAMRGSFDVLLDDRMIGEAGRQEPRLEPLDGSACLLTFFTSGSTGAPKRVPKTLAMFEREAETLQAVWKKDGQGTVFSTVPHQHVYGFSYKIAWPLATGRPFQAATNETWEGLLRDLTPAATIVSSPAHLGRMGGLQPLPADRRPARVFSAGAPLTYEAALEAERILGLRPTDIIGSTETGTIAMREWNGENQPWQSMPGLTLRCDEEGRLNLLSPYAGPEWIATADLIAPVPGGFRWLGRADRIVKIEGRRVSLNGVERALSVLPWVAAAAVVLLPGNPGRLGAVILPSETGKERLAALGKFRFGRLLRASLAETLEPASAPRHWRFVEALPSAELGKRRESDLLKLFEAAR